MLFSVASVVSNAVLWKVRARFARVEYGSDMRTAPALLTGLLVALTLVACVPDDEPVRPDPSPTESPIFASDEEALAAAEAAYGAYLNVSNEILNQGGLESERIYEFVSEEYRTTATSGFGYYEERGWSAAGTSTFDSASLQAYVDDGAGRAEVSIYLCLDVSGLRILDSSGADVTPERDERLPLEVRFENTNEYSNELLQTGSDVWSGDDFCE